MLDFAGVELHVAKPPLFSPFGQSPYHQPPFNFELVKAVDDADVDNVGSEKHCAVPEL